MKIYTMELLKHNKGGTVLPDEAMLEDSEQDGYKIEDFLSTIMVEAIISPSPITLGDSGLSIKTDKNAVSPGKDIAVYMAEGIGVIKTAAEHSKGRYKTFFTKLVKGYEENGIHMPFKEEIKIDEEVLNKANFAAEGVMYTDE